MAGYRVSLTVNGQPATASVESRETLADLLRDHLGLRGTNLGCEHGVCGSCTVLVDGASARSCLMLAVQADGRDVTTVEGLSDDDGTLHPAQAAFGRRHALQCGFCTPGFLITTVELLGEAPSPDRVDIRRRLSGNLCRCTGYQHIIDAVEELASGEEAG